MIGFDVARLHTDQSAMYLYDDKGKGWHVCNRCWERGIDNPNGPTWSTYFFPTAFELMLHDMVHHDG